MELYREIDAGLTDAQAIEQDRLAVDNVNSGRNDDPRKKDPITEKVDQVIDVLGKKIVGSPDRGRLRKALDSADAPPTGKEAANKALGNVIRRG